MWRLPEASALAQAWHEARPFPHVVIEDFVEDLDGLMAILEDEPVETYAADLYCFDATAHCLPPAMQCRTHAGNSWRSRKCNPSGNN